MQCSLLEILPNLASNSMAKIYKAALSAHKFQFDYKFDFEETKVLTTEINQKRREIK